MALTPWNGKKSEDEYSILNIDNISTSNFRQYLFVKRCHVLCQLASPSWYLEGSIAKGYSLLDLISLLYFSSSLIITKLQEPKKKPVETSKIKKKKEKRRKEMFSLKVCCF